MWLFSLLVAHKPERTGSVVQSVEVTCHNSVVLRVLNWEASAKPCQGAGWSHSPVKIQQITTGNTDMVNIYYFQYNCVFVSVLACCHCRLVGPYFLKGEFRNLRLRLVTSWTCTNFLLAIVYTHITLQQRTRCDVGAWLSMIIKVKHSGTSFINSRGLYPHVLTFREQFSRYVLLCCSMLF